MKHKIVCPKCKWKLLTNGTKEEVKDLYEYKTCANCTGRKFRCPKCGQQARMVINKK